MYIDIIKKYFPKIEIKTTKLITEGWESDILVVNDEIVFRFPKKDTRFDCVYEKEKIITDNIRKFITTEISNIQIYKEKDFMFSVIKLIKGENLYHIKADITSDFVNFLKEIHSIDVKPLKKYNLDANNLPFYRYRLTLNNFLFNYDTLPDFLKKYNLEEDFNKCINTFTAFDFRDEDDVLCHNDLHKGNVLVNGEKLSGIIDFGDAIYTNYNIEFISIFKWQEEIIIDIKQKYEEITGRKLNIEFITSIIKMAIYSKISYTEGNIDKYLKRLELFTAIEELFKEENSQSSEQNRQKLKVLFNDKMVIRLHK